MADIQVKKNGPQQSASMAHVMPRDPTGLITRMLGWDPFREMTPFFAEEKMAFDPAFEVKETKESFLFKADVPGIKQGDLEVSVTGNRLTIAGKRAAENTYERTYGSFSRTFTLPGGVDASSVIADLEDGVLAISVAKKPEAQPKKIPVGTEAKKS